MNLLIVDDEQPSRRMFRLALDTEHTVHEADNGASALEAMLARARHFLSKPTEPHTLRAAVAATRQKSDSTIAEPAPVADTTRRGSAITLNGFTVDASDRPAQVEGDGSAVHRLRVSHALESWQKIIAVRIGEHAFARTTHRDLATASQLAALVARHALVEHLWREGLLPSGDELTIDDVDTAHLIEAQWTATES